MEVLGKVKQQASEDFRSDMASAVNKFMGQEKAFNGIIKKLSASDNLSQEIGRNAAMIASRACQQAKDQGAKPPQSALWSVPSDQNDVGGAVATAINNQIEMAKSVGLVDESQVSDLIQESFAHSVQEGMRDPVLQEGASVMVEMFEGEAAQQPPTSARGILGAIEQGPSAPAPSAPASPLLT